MNTEIRREIGKRLRESRIAMGLTQQGAANELGLKSGQAVSLWECGDAMPKGDDWYKLGLLYGVSLDHLVYGNRSMPSRRSNLLQKILGVRGVQPKGAAFRNPDFSLSR